MEALFVRGISLGVYGQLGAELIAEEPEAVAETVEVVGEVTAV